MAFFHPKIYGYQIWFSIYANPSFLKDISPNQLISCEENSNQKHINPKSNQTSMEITSNCDKVYSNSLANESKV